MVKMADGKIYIIGVPENGVEELESGLIKLGEETERIELPESIADNTMIPLKKMSRWGTKSFAGKTPVVVNGSGNYHHLTYGICSSIPNQFGYVHFDRHDDLGGATQGYVTMAAFVAPMMFNTSAEDYIMIGSYHDAGKSIGFNSIDSWKKRLPGLLAQLPDDVYVSVDLDVLDPERFYSGYDAGTMLPSQLMYALDMIGENKKVVGGDICGYRGSSECSGRLLVDSKDISLETIIKLRDMAYKP